MPTDYAWQLTEIVGPDGTMATLATGTAPTLVMEDGNAAGNASCNQYGGSYDLDGSSITFGPLFSTEMFCGDPGVMDQEAAYLTALESVDGWAIDGETYGVYQYVVQKAEGSRNRTYPSMDLIGPPWDAIRIFPS